MSIEDIKKIQPKYDWRVFIGAVGAKSTSLMQDFQLFCSQISNNPLFQEEKAFRDSYPLYKIFRSRDCPRHLVYLLELSTNTIYHISVSQCVYADYADLKTCIAEDHYKDAILVVAIDPLNREETWNILQEIQQWFTPAYAKYYDMCRGRINTMPLKLIISYSHPKDIDILQLIPTTKQLSLLSSISVVETINIIHDPLLPFFKCLEMASNMKKFDMYEIHADLQKSVIDAMQKKIL